MAVFAQPRVWDAERSGFPDIGMKEHCALNFNG